MLDAGKKAGHGCRRNGCHDRRAGRSGNACQESRPDIPFFDRALRAFDASAEAWAAQVPPLLGPRGDGDEDPSLQHGRGDGPLAALPPVARHARALADGAGEGLFRLARPSLAVARQAAAALAQGRPQERRAWRLTWRAAPAKAGGASPASRRCRRTSASTTRNGSSGPSTSCTRRSCCSSSGGTMPRPACAAYRRTMSACSNSRSGRCWTSSRPPTSS